jgi:hypothetical protein
MTGGRHRPLGIVLGTLLVAHPAFALEGRTAKARPPSARKQAGAILGAFEDIRANGAYMHRLEIVGVRRWRSAGGAIAGLIDVRARRQVGDSEARFPSEVATDQPPGTRVRALGREFTVTAQQPGLDQLTLRLNRRARTYHVQVPRDGVEVVKPPAK